MRHQRAANRATPPPGCFFQLGERGGGDTWVCAQFGRCQWGQPMCTTAVAAAEGRVVIGMFVVGFGGTGSVSSEFSRSLRIWHVHLAFACTFCITSGHLMHGVNAYNCKLFLQDFPPSVRTGRCSGLCQVGACEHGCLRMLDGSCVARVLTLCVGSWQVGGMCRHSWPSVGSCRAAGSWACAWTCVQGG